MKRILLALSLISFAAQTSMHAESTTAQLLKENFHAYAYDAKQLTSKAPQLAEKVLQGTETVLTLPFVLAGKGFEYGAKAIEPGFKEIEPTLSPMVEKIGNGLVSAGNGLVYVGTTYPATSMVTLSALSIASWAKGLNCDPNNQRKQADFYMLTGFALGIASMAVLANVCVEHGIQF